MSAARLLFASVVTCWFGLLPAQTIIPLVDCVEPLTRSTGATRLANNVAAGVPNTEAVFEAALPGGSRITMNPGAANQETFINTSSSPITSTFRTFTNAHTSGEPVEWEHIVSLVHFGYFNAGTAAVNIVAGSSSNFLSPGNPNRGQPSVFVPGLARRAFSAGHGSMRDLVWIVDTQFTVARIEPAFYCPEPGAVPSVVGRTLTLTAGSSNPGLTLGSAAVANDPAATLTIQVPSLWIANPLTTPTAASAADITISNARFQNGAIVGDVTVGSTVPRRYAAVLQATSPKGTVGYGYAFIEVRNDCALNVTPASLPQATQTIPYNPVTFGANGGTAPYSFTADSSALPPGMSLANGVLSGTPTMTGSYPLSVLVTDAGSCMTRANYTLTVAGPSCATNVTPQVEVSLSGLRRNLTTGRFSQTVTLRNASASPLTGPIALALDNLSANATLFNPNGTTACSAPLGRPFVLVPVGSDEAFTPGETAAVTLEFVNSQTWGAITYTPRVLAGGSQR